MLVRISSAIAVLLLVVGCGTQDGRSRTTSETTTASGEQTLPGMELTASQERGKELFDIVCWTCHGTSGRGDGPAVRAGSVEAPPNLLGSPYATLTPEAIVGRFGAVADEPDEDHPHMQYVSSLIRPERFREALRYVSALAYPPDLPGSALAGREIYEARCQGCHGGEGRGDGPWADELEVQPPADFTHDTLLASRDWEAAFTRIREGGRTVHGSSMPPWGIVLSEGEIWDVLAYISLFQLNAGT